MYLVASAGNTRLRPLPAGSAYCIGSVLIPRCTGPLVPPQGSLARAALPDGAHRRWGWPRVERARERGKFSLAALCDSAFTWGLERLPVEPVPLGRDRRTGPAVDSATSARGRSGKARPVLGKGYGPRAQRAVRATSVAALTSGVRSRGVRVGVVRRTRCERTCEAALAALFPEMPPSADKRRFSVEAGSASREQCAAATEPAARVGRWRKNVAVRRAPQPHRRGQRGRPPVQGPVLPPGARRPEGRADDDPTLTVADRQGRVRRGKGGPGARTPQTGLDGVRVADPAYQRPLRSGTTARELTTEELRPASGQRWPVATNVFVAQGPCVMEQPRAWTATAVSRRLTLALLCASLRKAIAAACEALPMGPWERKAVCTAGRLANHLDRHARHFAALALSGLEPRNYVKISDPQQTNDFPLPKAA